MAANEEALMWVEKYRPKNLTEVVDLHDIVGTPKSFHEKAKNDASPDVRRNTRTGKTTLALCIAHELFGPNWKSFTLELNASDERGIDTVRERVKDFSRYSRSGFGNVPFALNYS